MNWKYSSLLMLALVLVLSLTTVIKIYLNAQREYRLGADFVSQNNLMEAVSHYERSIQWFLPGLSLQDKAAHGLWDVAEKYEAQGDTENALNAYRLLRGAFFSARSFYTPGKIWIHRANEKIATLMAGQPASSDVEKTKTFAERRKENLKLLTADKIPNNRWALLAEIGFWGWVACAVLFIFRAVNKTGAIKQRPAFFWVAGFILFYGLWILGLLNA